MYKFCEKHKTIAQQKYHKKYFDQYKDNSKNQWEMINILLGRKLFRKNHIKLRDNDGNIISSTKEVMIISRILRPI